MMSFQSQHKGFPGLAPPPRPAHRAGVHTHTHTYAHTGATHTVDTHVHTACTHVPTPWQPRQWVPTPIHPSLLATDTHTCSQSQNITHTVSAPV